MKTIVEGRASIILYNFLVSNNLNKGKLLLPANICPVVPATLYKAKVSFEFIDINFDDLSISTQMVLERIENDESISSLLITNTYGAEIDRADFFKKVKSLRPDIVIIYDRCLNIPFTTPSLLGADMVLQSTGYSKYVDIGYGGYAFIDEEFNYHKEELPFDSKKHDVLVKQFSETLTQKTNFNYVDSDWLGSDAYIENTNSYFEKINTTLKKVEIQKNTLNNIYQSNLKSEILLESNFNIWRFNIVVKNKQKVLNEIFKADLFASSHYQSLAGLYGKGIGAKAESLHNQVINLFNDYRYTIEKAKGTCEIINKHALYD